MSELFKRVVVAVFGIPAAFFIVYMGGVLFNLSVAVLSCLALWEYYGMAEKKGANPKLIPGLLLNLHFILFTGFVPADKLGYAIHLICGMALLAFFAFFVELFSKKTNHIINLAVTGWGWFYTGLLFSFLIFARRAGDIFPFAGGVYTFDIRKDDIWGVWFLLTIFVSIWSCDSFAYFAGKAFGKHKIFPRVSPKKSWEGSIAGFVFSVAAVIGMNYALTLNLGIIHSLALGAIIGVTGQIGDFAESLLKRDAGIKDSSALIPGHGGILDRFDSILFAVPAAYCYLFLSFAG